MTDIYLDSGFNSERDPINDTRTITDERETAQQCAVKIRRLLLEDGAMNLTPRRVAQLEDDIATTIRSIEDIETIHSVSTTRTGEETLQIAVRTDFVNFERPFSLTR